MSLYYADGDRQVGPISKSQLQALVKARTLTAKTLVWQPGMNDWEELGRFVKRRRPSEAKPEDQPVKRAACAECGQMVAEEDMIRFNELRVCAACKPTFVQKIKEGVSVAGALDYAGFWRRLGALMLDAFIMWTVNMILYVPMIFVAAGAGKDPTVAVTLQLVIMFLQIVLAAAYATWFVGKYGATPGKMAFKMKILSSDGEKISYGRALGRHFATMISGMTMMIGYLMAAFDDEKRTLHDRICDTRVVRSES
jgi:uncharacterized RDD family membrane protein YckC